MFTVKNKTEFIADIRALDKSLENLRLNSVEIEREKFRIRYNFICDVVVSQELQQKILAEAEKITLPVFTDVEVSVKKIVSNAELVSNEIYRFLNAKYPSVSIFLKPTDVICTNVGNVVKYVLRLTKDGAEYVTKNGALGKLNEHLAKCFCSDFVGSTEIKEAEESISLLSDEVYEKELEKIEHRTIKVKDVIVIDDYNMGDVAVYIEDITDGEVTICGTITDIVEKETKNGKPFLVIHIDDTTGKTSGVYFSKKYSFNKIKELAVGDAIIARGKSGEYNGRRSFTFDKINRCTFPEDFVKKDKYKKSAPKEYKLIFPEPATTVKVNTVFNMEEVLPKELTDKVYVVFDIETTGLELTRSGITEIGAVKLVNGIATEHFTTLIKPDYRIDEENEKLTGISEEMVKDAPKISSVIPDFMKFIEGAILVAHNAEFDVKFIKYFAGAEDYEVKNEVLDTMALARKYMPQLKNHKLNTIADYLGISFNHHRALNDAYCTVDVLTELMKIKNNV